MKSKHAGWAVALAAVLAVPAFAQVAVTSASGTTVTSGTGVVVTPGAPALVPLTVAVPGAVVAEIGTRTTVSGNVKTTITDYWANVPPDVMRDARFQRWQALK